MTTTHELNCNHQFTIYKKNKISRKGESSLTSKQQNKSKDTKLKRKS